MPNTKVVIIGAGNIAEHIGIALYQAGIHIVGVYSRTKEHAQQLAYKLGGCISIDNLSEIPEADFYWLAVSDDIITTICERLPSHCTRGIVLHSSGSMSIDAIGKQFINRGVCYPLQTFTRGVSVDMSQVYFFIEGFTAEVENSIVKLAMVLSSHVTRLKSKQRLKLHLAAVFANNFVNHLYEISSLLLEESGGDKKALTTLLTETLRKYTILGAGSAQTGPAKRGDIQVLQKHLELLQNKIEWKEIYQVLSTSIFRQYNHD